MTESGVAVTQPQAHSKARELHEHFSRLGLQAVFCKTINANPIPMAGTTGGDPEFGVYVEPAKGYTRPAFRVPTNAIVLDVDLKPGRADGVATLRAVEDELGELPPTQRLTAHGYDDGAGRRLFRIPDGMHVDEGFFKAFGGAIDVVRTGHRFSMAPGDVHHRTGTPVVCYGPDGQPDELWPVDRWPMLPVDWILALDEYSPAATDDDDELGGGLERVKTEHEAKAVVAHQLAAIRSHDTTGSGFRALLRSASITVGGFVGSLYADEHEAAVELALAVRDVWGAKPDHDDKAMIRSGVKMGAEKAWTVLPAEPATVTPIREGVAIPADTRPTVVAGNAAEAADWLAETIGTGRLASMFNRDGRIVHTPQIGEEGYVSLTRGAMPDPRNYDGPAQIRVMSADQLISKIQFAYRPIRINKTDGRTTRVMFPREAASVVVNSPEAAPSLRALTGVTHTPAVRADGSVLDQPGYDAETGYLFLPSAGPGVPAVPDSPSAADRTRARALIDSMLVDYRFVTEHSRANYLAYLLTPLLRMMRPAPYPLFAFDARMPASGKTMLAKIGHQLHGGTFRSSFPDSEEEIGKEVTTILGTATAPMVLFDNVKGTLRSAKLEGLLTSSAWSQRLLGGNESPAMTNDRVWAITSNNASVGGDMARRTLRIDIDPGVPHPELRTGFTHSDLPGWVSAHRGELLWSLLVLARAWVVDGAVAGPVAGQDNYAAWTSACGGIVAAAGYEGVVGYKEPSELVSADDDELGELLAALWDEFGGRGWTVKEVMGKADSDFDDSELRGALPEHVQQRLAFGAAGAVKIFGKWLANRKGRWANGMCVVPVPQAESSKTSRKWMVRKYDV